MSRYGLGVVVAITACASWSQPPKRRSVLEDVESHTDKTADTFIAAANRHDVAGVAHFLRNGVVFGGAWFPSPECRHTFPAPGKVTAEGLPTLARCLSELHFAKSERRGAFPEIAVLTYDPGLEIEVQFADDDADTIKWIGYVARSGRKDALPTISQRSLEGLRTDATAPLEFDAETLSKISAEHVEKRPTVVAWFKVCLDASGAVTSVNPKLTNSIAARDAAASIQRATFRPFAIGEQTMPVCSMVRLVSGRPPEPEDHADHLPYPVSPAYESALILAAHGLEARRRSGEKFILPPLNTKTEIQRSGAHQIMGLVWFCTNVRGDVETVEMIRSTAFPDYDKAILDGVRRWAYDAPSLDGAPSAFCTHIMFIYSQH